MTQVHGFLRAIDKQQRADLIHQITAVRTVWADESGMRNILDELTGLPE